MHDYYPRLSEGIPRKNVDFGMLSKPDKTYAAVRIFRYNTNSWGLTNIPTNPIYSDHSVNGFRSSTNVCLCVWRERFDFQRW